MRFLTSFFAPKVYCTWSLSLHEQAKTVSKTFSFSQRYPITNFKNRIRVVNVVQGYEKYLKYPLSKYRRYFLF